MPRTFQSVAAAVCVLTAAPAFADLTAEDVWADLQAYSTSFGYEIKGQTERSGDTFIITDMTVSAPQLNDSNTGSMKVDRLVLREEPDGSVAIDLPTVMPIEMITEIETGETAVIRMDYSQTGLNIVVTGSPEDILYTYQAEALTLRSNPIFIEGLSGGEPQPVMNLSVTDISGTTDMIIDSQRRYDQNVQAAQATYSIMVTDPEKGESVDIKGEMNDLSFTGSTALPLRSISVSDINAMLAAGFTVDGQFTYETSGLEMGGESATETFSAVLAGQQGRIGVKMNADQLEYDVSQSNSNLQMTSAQFPIPIAFDVAKSSFQIALPIQQSDEPQDFALGFSLDGFSMSDVIWGIFDPTNQLPRDPAVVALDLAGKAKLFFNFLDPDLSALQSQTAGDPPAELESVKINRLQMSVAGADLSGEGSFNFETTPMGVPQPVGGIDLTLVGGNALIDKLVAVGLVPEQQAMGARMMLGLLAVPGDTPDTLNSKIEINEMGHILANGQRIQ